MSFGQPVLVAAWASLHLYPVLPLPSLCSMPDVPLPSPPTAGGSPVQPAVTIGDRRFPIAELSDEAQKLVLAVRDCEEQITQMKRRLNYLEIARRTLIQELTSRLPE